MSRPATVSILSDVHYAAAAEQARGITEFEIIRNPFLLAFVKVYRHFLWKRDPFGHNQLLDDFIERERGAEYVIGNGDYSCDTAFVGVCDPAAYASAECCLDKLRAQFGTRLHLILGDHELGKVSLFGGKGGMRLASWNQATAGLRLEPFWKLEIGSYVLLGVTSSLLAISVFEPDTLPEERPRWFELGREHLAEIAAAFQALSPSQKVILFCHDPTAIPFLWREPAIRSRASQIELTIIGHLHSELFLWKSRLLAGMPAIRFLGNSVRRMSTALHEARVWRQFRVKLCPALAGIELLKDGGYCRLSLDLSARNPARFERCRFA